MPPARAQPLRRLGQPRPTRSARDKTAAVPPWAWALIGLVVGIPFCAQLNCYIERKRDECDRRKDEVDNAPNEAERVDDEAQP